MENIARFDAEAPRGKCRPPARAPRPWREPARGTKLDGGVSMPAKTLKGDRVPIRIWADLDETEAEALDQLRNLAALPWAFAHVAAMPDLHSGIGAAIGSVVAMKGAFAPAAVGVDIGCGMAAVRTSLSAGDLPDSLKPLRLAIEQAVPSGFREHREPVAWTPAETLFGGFGQLDPGIANLREKASRQLGTLGGGNHFIELALDEQERLWIMLHSGSRHLGKELAEVHMARARHLSHNQGLPDPHLSVFLEGSPEFAACLRDYAWAQAYARENRALMLHLVKAVLARSWPAVGFDEPIACHHNYVARETHFGEEVLVTRKGAIHCGRGELGLIPGSMGSKSFIVRGLGCADAFDSASHGAGRKMSRSRARKLFRAHDVQLQTAGVECRKDAGIVDELPGAYKDPERVMARQRDLVETVHTLKPLVCVKG